MAIPIKLKNSNVGAKVPLTTDLVLGELAVNTYDGKIYLKKDVAGTETIVKFEETTKTLVDGLGINATQLGGLSSSQFLRSDADDTGTNLTLTSLTATGSNAIMWENGVNRISHNDGGGNVQIRFGHEYTTSDVFTHAGTAFYVGGSLDSATGILSMKVASNGGAGVGNTVVWGDALNITSNTMVFGGNTIWHAGNDGSGSGLDADRLDGLHASSFVQGTSVAPDAVFAYVVGSGLGGISIPSSVWTTAPITTQQRNVLGVTLLSNQITGIAAGDYYIEWEMDLNLNGASSSSVSSLCQTQIYDITGAGTVIPGISSQVGGYDSNVLVGSGFWSPTVTSALEVRAFSSGLNVVIGTPTDSGIDNELLKIRIWKI